MNSNDITSLPDCEFKFTEQVDIICDAFEIAWASGVEPTIAQFLDGTEGTVRKHLIEELLLLDVELRTKRGQQLSRQDYLERCPEIESIIDSPDVSVRVTELSKQQREVPFGISRFELLEPIGEGASGTVWRARDLSLRRVVALKLPRLQQLSAAERARFRREGQACAQLQHPNIVTVLEVGDEGGIYIASELIDGWSLREWLEQHKHISPLQAVSFAVQLAAALSHAHAKGVIHRDLKPANILIDKGGNPFLTDFGLACWSDQSVALSLEGHIVGTPAYMSPEQARGEIASIDWRTDIYGLGAVLYELLSGKPPFEGDITSVIHQVVTKEPSPPTQLNSSIPRDLETICLKAMQKRKDDRYQTMRAFSDDLQRFQRGEPIQARATGSLVRLWKLTKRHKAIAGMLAACLVALIAFAGIAIVANENHELRGYRTVTLSTRPSNAAVAFIPLSDETGEPELHRRVLASSLSPVTLDLLPGDYLVVVAMPDGRFHEVYRHVPRADEQQEFDAHYRRFQLLEDGTIRLATINLPALQTSTGMVSVPGNEYFAMGSHKTFGSPPYTVNIRPFFVDPHEVTRKEYSKYLGKGDDLNSELSDVARAVRFHEALSFAEKLGKRLPTEAEFEYLATNNGSTKYPWGDECPANMMPSVPYETGDHFGPIGIPEFDQTVKFPAVVGLCSNKAEWVMPTTLPKKFAPAFNRSISLDSPPVYRGGSALTISGNPLISPHDRNPRNRAEVSDRLVHSGISFRCVRSAHPLLSFKEMRQDVN